MSKIIISQFAYSMNTLFHSATRHKCFPPIKAECCEIAVFWDSSVALGKKGGEKWEAEIRGKEAEEREAESL